MMCPAMLIEWLVRASGMQLQSMRCLVLCSTSQQQAGWFASCMWHGCSVAAAACIVKRFICCNKTVLQGTGKSVTLGAVFFSC